MKRPKRRPPLPRFDTTTLTPADHAMLAAFTERRAGFDRALAASNILYHKRTCPACGFPTLDEQPDCETCVLCLWEDLASEADPAVIAPPNYVSLVEERIKLSRLLVAFEQAHTISPDLDTIIQSIRNFKRRLARGDVAIDREDFDRNVQAVLPTTRS